MIFNVSFLCLTHYLSLSLFWRNMWRTSSGNVCLWWQAFRGGSVSCWLVVWWLLATFLSYISIPFYPCLCSILWNSGSLLKHMIIGTWSEAEARSRFFNLFPLCILCLTWILLDAVTICYHAVVVVILFHVVSKVQLKIDNYDKMVPELLKAFAEPGTGIAESMLDFRRVLEDQLRRLNEWASFAHMGHRTILAYNTLIYIRSIWDYKYL